MGLIFVTIYKPKWLTQKNKFIEKIMLVQKNGTCIFQLQSHSAKFDYLCLNI